MSIQKQQTKRFRLFFAVRLKQILLSNIQIPNFQMTCKNDKKSTTHDDLDLCKNISSGTT